MWIQNYILIFKFYFLTNLFVCMSSLFLMIDIIYFKFNIKLYVIFTNMHRRLTIILYAHLICFLNMLFLKNHVKFVSLIQRNYPHLYNYNS
jgi:hypothetical protein